MSPKKDKKRNKQLRAGASTRPALPPTIVNGGDGDAEAQHSRLPRKEYDRELLRLQTELVAMQEWIRASGARVVVIFEGRDAAGKGGTINRITQYLSPRVARVVALPVPSDRQRSQWYFQRYVEQLPAAGELVIFDRSWYNRAGVERVLGFCTEAEYQRFLQQCPEFERMLVADGIILLKYWMSVSEEEQERRFRARMTDPLRRWKLSTTDFFSRTRWVDYSRAKDAMFAACDIPEAPWWTVESDDKRAARINCISHLLASVPYQKVKQDKLELPPRQEADGYVRPPRSLYRSVPDVASALAAQYWLDRRQPGSSSLSDEVVPAE